jgi:hypothetical protein
MMHVCKLHNILNLAIGIIFNRNSFHKEKPIISIKSLLDIHYPFSIKTVANSQRVITNKDNTKTTQILCLW